MLNNNILKVISILIAVVVWFIVATSEQQEVSFYVPVKFKNEAEGLKAFTDTTLLSVLVKGPKVSMKSFTFNDIKIEIDLRDFKSGEYLYRIKPTDVLLPSGIHLIRVEPQDIRVTIDKLGKKTVKVVPSFIGEVKEGYKILSVLINPSMVTIYGNNKRIKSLDSIETLPINISEIDTTTRQKVGIKIGEAIFDAKPKEVDVEIKISENVINKVLSNLEIDYDNLKPGFKVRAISRDKFNVDIKGRADKINSVEKVRLYVDLSHITKEGKYELPVLSSKIDGVEVLNIYPDKIKLEVKK